MVAIKVPWLRQRRDAHGVRFYFEPESRHRSQGWRMLRLLDPHGRPCADALAAARVCQPIAALYAAWRAGDAGAQPARIGTDCVVRDVAALSATAIRKAAPTARFRPGTIGAIVVDYRASRHFLTVKDADGRRIERPAATRRSYGQCLDLLVAAWGTVHWAEISPSMAEDWIEDLMQETPAFGHAVYRVARLVLNVARRLYPSDASPGFVPKGANPFERLDMPTPKADPHPWPASIVPLFVASADAIGLPSIGDAIHFNAWLGQRNADIVALSLAAFEPSRPLWVSQTKTGADVILPWSMVPGGLDRWRAAVERRRASPRRVAATTFVIDDRTGRPLDVDRMRALYGETRAHLVATLRGRAASGDARWPADYLARHFADDPFAVDAARLKLASLRATAVTRLAEAGVADIGAITGHSDATLTTILAHYRARTTTRATAAFQQRLDHEGKAR